MGRKTQAARHADKLDRAAADAAALMSANIAKMSGQMEALLSAAGASQDEGERMSLLARFGELVDAQAKLGQTIARMRGEIRQRISVHRTANADPNAPQLPPNVEAQRRRNLRKVAEILGKYPRKSKGEGEGAQAQTWQSAHPPLQKALEEWRKEMHADREPEEEQSPAARAENG